MTQQRRPSQTYQGRSTTKSVPIKNLDIRTANVGIRTDEKSDNRSDRNSKSVRRRHDGRDPDAPPRRTTGPRIRNSSLARSLEPE